MQFRSIMNSLAAVGLGLILLYSTACSSVNKAPAIDPTQAVKLLEGEYTTTITQEDVTKLGSLEPDIAANIGDWKITIKSDGTAVAVLDDNKDSIDLSYQINGSEMKIYIHNGDCRDNIGRYQWNLKDTQLYFAKIVDMCDAEVLILTSHPLVQVSK